jgi:hypothetical protein
MLKVEIIPSLSVFFLSVFLSLLLFISVSLLKCLIKFLSKSSVCIFFLEKQHFVFLVLKLRVIHIMAII